MKITVFGSSHGNPTPGRFQTSLLLQCGGNNYMIDAAEPATAMLINRGICPAELTAIFVTHMHIDHTGGLPAMLYQVCKHRFKFPSGDTKVYLPDPAAPEALYAWMRANSLAVDKFDMCIADSTAVYTDDAIKVSFIPTRHLDCAADGSPRSFSIAIEAEGKKVIFSGDLAPDFQDFPVDFAKDCDAVFCELTHYKLPTAIDTLKKLKSGSKLYFYHLHDPHQTPEGEAKVLDICQELPCRTMLVKDGDEISL